MTERLAIASTECVRKIAEHFVRKREAEAPVSWGFSFPRIRIAGIQAQMESFDYYFDVMCG